MNERIRELVREAGLSIKGHYDESGSTPAELQKFAELIIKDQQREWVGLTDEEARQTFARHNCTISADLAGILARAIEAKLRSKNT